MDKEKLVSLAQVEEAIKEALTELSSEEDEEAKEILRAVKGIEDTLGIEKSNAGETDSILSSRLGIILRKVKDLEEEEENHKALKADTQAIVRATTRALLNIDPIMLSGMQIVKIEQELRHEGIDIPTDKALLP